MKVPWLPVVPACTTKVGAVLSTSLAVSVPPVVIALLVSSTATTALLNTEASSVPLMVTVITWVVPSVVATAMLSV